MLVETETATGGFVSLAKLRSAHLDLLRAATAARQGSQPAPDVAAIRAFLATAQATGAQLDQSEERDTAQGILDYWTAELIATSDPATSTGPMLLAPFDTSLAPDLSTVESPFKSLDAFAPTDAERFFGRDDAVRQLAEQVRLHPVVIVHGPSGSGKSSLVMAGLVPRLAGPQPDGAPPWRILGPLMPGADPLSALLHVLAPDIAPKARDAARARLLADPAEAAALLADAPPSLLVVSQFGEVFTLGSNPKVQAAFAAALMALGPRHRVVIIMRQDFLGPTARLPGLDAVAKDPARCFSPAPLSAWELRRVIERPAQIAGLRFDDGIVDDLVREVQNEPAALPLLQTTLAQLWERRERNRITWASYRAVGSPRTALMRTAERTFTGLPTAEARNAAKRIFLLLAQPIDGGEVRRRRLTREALQGLDAPEALDAALRPWVEAGLIRCIPGADHAQDRFEIAHSVLVQTWPRLTDWVQEERGRSQRRLQIESTARLWLETRRPGYLLKGAALTEAARFRENSDEVTALVDASEARQRRVNAGWYAGGSVVATLLIGLTIAALYQTYRVSAAKELQANTDAGNVVRLATRLDEQRDDYEGSIAVVRWALEERNARALESALRSLDIDVPANSIVLRGAAPSSAPQPAVAASPSTNEIIRQLQPLSATGSTRGIRPPEPSIDPPVPRDAPLPASAPAPAAVSSPSPIPPPVPEKIMCSGAIWLGADGSNVRDGPPLDATDWIGRTVHVGVEIWLRRGVPDSNYRNQQGILVLPAGTPVVAQENPVGYPRPNNVVQYWIRVGVPGRACSNVYLQFTGEPAVAEAFRGRLVALGYTVPKPEQLRSAQGLAEVRFFYDEDRIAAEQLAKTVEALGATLGGLQGRKIGVNDRSDGRMPKPPMGTLELWLDPSDGPA